MRGNGEHYVWQPMLVFTIHIPDTAVPTLPLGKKQACKTQLLVPLSNATTRHQQYKHNSYLT